MNKRLKRKRKKILDERYKFIARIRSFNTGRRNGKTFMYFQITKALLSWEYAPFKRIKKLYTI